MLFPMALCREGKKYFFQWGFIEKEIDVTSLKELIKKNKYKVRNAGDVVHHSSIIIPEKSVFNIEVYLNHSKNSELKDEVFKIMNIPADITYNEFAIMEKELTIEQIFEHLI